jgi:ribosomal protein S18 acetylase RimI-like enzyme
MNSSKRRRFTIRPATAVDTHQIARAFLDSADHHARLDPERYVSPTVESVYAHYEQKQQSVRDSISGSATLVAELNGEVVGFVDLRLEHSPDPMHRRIIYCHVAEIAVKSDFRGQGLGQRLLQAGEDWGRARGAHFASLEFHAANLRAGRFYQQRMGYSVASMIAIKRLSDSDVPVDHNDPSTDNRQHRHPYRHGSRAKSA